MEARHSDCRRYVPVDAAKGICRRTGGVVNLEDLPCQDLILLPKCKYCAHYLCDEREELGICAAEADRPWTYPELVAATCSWFLPRESGGETGDPALDQRRGLASSG
jgi:4-hydroxyphenylacetate decarboxylase small subunit